MEDIKLNEIALKVLNDKFNDGTIEKKISDSIDKCLNDIIAGMFSRYDSPLKQQMQEKLQPIISLGIANSTFEGLTEKLSIIINDLIEKSEFSKITNLEKIHNVLGRERKFYDRKPVTLSEIFNKYNEWLKKELEHEKYEQNELEFDDGSTTVYFNTSLEKVEEDTDNPNDRLYLLSFRENDKYRLKCEIYNPDVLFFPDDFHYDIEFSIRDSYDGKKRINISKNLTIQELRELPPFMLYLYDLSNDLIDIEIDKTYLTDIIGIDVEYEY